MSAGGVQSTWVDAILDLWVGCTPCSPGCYNCTTLKKQREEGTTGLVIRDFSEWDRVRELKKGSLVMLCPASDAFLDQAIERGWVKDLFALVASHPDLIFLILTKRLSNAKKVMPEVPLPNLWLGTSVENQEAADERIPELYSIPAAGYIISVQPLIDAINLMPYLSHPKLKKVIVGGELGDRARYCDLEWIKSIQEQCDRAGVKCFVTRYTVNGRRITLPTITRRPSHAKGRYNYGSGHRVAPIGDG
jgi:protein gp37